MLSQAAEYKGQASKENFEAQTLNSSIGFTSNIQYAENCYLILFHLLAKFHLIQLDNCHINYLKSCGFTFFVLLS